MRRRAFLASLAAPPLASMAAPERQFDGYFLDIVRGFLRNARRTTPSYALCDFSGGTLLKSCTAPNGKTYVSVARMLPAMAAWAAAGKTPALDLPAVLRSIYRSAFDPAHPDYWGEPPSDKASQRQVEASLVAHSLWVLGDRFLSTLAARDRANIQAWLAACNRVPERQTNHAWFSAINQGARLSLGRRWKEFSGDESWMLEDLRALDGLGSPGDGWYSDAPSMPIFDYYNFWTFASHFLQWNEMLGARYPEVARRFRDRLHLFLTKTPYFFAGHGGHVLFGRSLIYRWAVVLPLVQAYRQKLWPHSPGLLRRIVRRNLEYHWQLGAFDSQAGKLLETFSASGTPDVREMYIDNGHPYWCMMAFTLFGIPPGDPFWTAPEEPLPVERGDFRVSFPGARMLLVGARQGGQVRWLQARNAAKSIRYRDKYIKFSYSSHFPYNVCEDPDHAPWDATLVFRDPRTGVTAARGGVLDGELTEDGAVTDWWAQLSEWRFEVKTRLRVRGEYEERVHQVRAPVAALRAGVEVLEGSHALGLANAGELEEQTGERLRSIRSRKTGYRVVTWARDGYENVETTRSFFGREKVNLVYPLMAINTLRTTLRAEQTVLSSLHYCSPLPPAKVDPAD